MHICQIRPVSARRDIDLLTVGFPEPACRGILQAPLGKERRGRFWPHQGAFVPVRSGRRPQLGVSGQQTHADIWVERPSATSLSVPPRCLLSYELTRSRNCSSPLHTHTHTHHHRHTCESSINSQKPHMHRDPTYLSMQNPDCYGRLSPPPSPFFFLFWWPLKFFCLRPTFKCLFIRPGLIVFPARSV